MPGQPVGVPRRPLVEYVRTLGATACLLSLDDGKLVLQGERCQATFAVTALEGPPFSLGDKPETVAILGGPDIAQAARITYACARENTRPALEFVWLCPRNEAIASDGFRLARAGLTTEVSQPVPVPPSLLQAAARAGADEMIVSCSKGHYEYRLPGLRLVGVDGSWKPPDFDKVLDRFSGKPDVTATVETAPLLRVLRHATGVDRAFLYWCAGALRLVLGKEDGEDRLVTDIDGTGAGEGRVLLNPVYLREALVGPVATLGYGGSSDAPVRIESDGILALVMPRFLATGTWPAAPTPANASMASRANATAGGRVAGVGAASSQEGT